jgi:hypothetical protein
VSDLTTEILEGHALLLEATARELQHRASDFLAYAAQLRETLRELRQAIPQEEAKPLVH